MKIKKGDTILIVAGKDKGKKGKVEKVYSEIAKVLIPGLNIYKRHQKKRDERHQGGGIIEFSRPLPIGSVAVVCPSCGKPTRVGFLVTKEDKTRICKKCKAKI